MTVRSTPPVVPSGVHQRLGRVLIIDDDTLVADALARLLATENQITICSRGDEALAQYEAGERFDVVLCDLMMPYMNGMEFYERLSATLPDEANRIVFLTGAIFLPHVRAFVDRVSNVCIEKPPDIDGLRDLVRRRVRGQEREAGGTRRA